MPYGQFLAWTVSSKALSAVSLGPLGGCPFRRYSTGSCRMTQVSKGHHSRASRAKKGSREPQTLVIYRECWKEGQAIGEGRKEGISEWTRDLGCSLSPGNKSQATGSLLSHPGGHAKQPPRVRGAPTSTTARHTHTRAPPPHPAGSQGPHGLWLRWPLGVLCPGPFQASTGPMEPPAAPAAASGPSGPMRLLIPCP